MRRFFRSLSRLYTDEVFPSFPISRNSRWFRQVFFPDTGEEALFEKRDNMFPFSITPYFLSLIKGEEKGLRRTVIPLREEMEISPDDMIDPLAEHDDTAAPESPNL
jgi:L-lysine 2,3-aminomutase